mgnify:CR=1 FL=1
MQRRVRWCWPPLIARAACASHLFDPLTSKGEPQAAMGARGSARRSALTSASGVSPSSTAPSTAPRSRREVARRAPSAVSRRCGCSQGPRGRARPCFQGFGFEILVTLVVVTTVRHRGQSASGVVYTWWCWGAGSPPAGAARGGQARRRSFGYEPLGWGK